MINCTLCDLPLGKTPFSVQVFYNDGTEEVLKNTIVPEDMRAVVVYSHEGCKTISAKERKCPKLPKVVANHPPLLSPNIEKELNKHFKIVKKENRFLIVLPRTGN